MSRIRLVLLSMLAVFAVSAVVATGAQADPWWIVPCHPVLAANIAESRWNNPACTNPMVLGGGYDIRLLKNETRTTTSKNVSVFKLKAASLAIECPTETDTGELKGGWPGTDTSEITFEGCHVAARTVAQCGAASGSTAGKIGPFKVKTLLGFPKGKAGGTEEAYDQFFPGGESETEFTTFTLTGTACGETLNNAVIKVVATGTKAVVMGTPRCGAIATVGKIVSGKVKATKSGEVATEGGLNLKETPPTEEEVWNPTTNEYEVVKCGLESRSVKVGNATAEEIGEAKVETTPAEEFGWEA